MNIIEKSESIRAGLRKGFQDGTSKMAQRRCYGYDTDADGELAINPDEAAAVRWIFDRYISGDSLGKIAVGLEEQGMNSPHRKTQMEPGGHQQTNLQRKIYRASVAPENYQRRRL